MREGGTGGAERGEGGRAAFPRAPRPVAAPGPAAAPRSFGLVAPGYLVRLSAHAGRFRDWLAQSLGDELNAGGGFAWAIVAFAVGAAIYLGLPHEPSFVALTGLAAAALATLIYRRRRAEHAFGTLVAVMAILGVWFGSLESIRSAGPRLDRERIVTVTGRIVGEETVLKGATRASVAVVDMTAKRLEKSAVPALITVTFRAGPATPRNGEAVRFLAKMRPLQGPVMPGGYDFARRAFFDGRGATGFAMGKITRVDLGPAPFAMAALAAVADLRHTIAERIRASLPGASGAIAAAMIVGEQRGIPDAENDALRMSGLSHIISISGLHMSLVASGVFLVVRFLLALIPPIALRFPIKKWAAGAALFAISFYMMLAGDQVAAERSYVMCAIMLFAILIGRPALSMRNVALSALLLLARDPAQVVEPSFLMSYLAVIALIGSYQAWRQFRLSHPQSAVARDVGPIAHVLRSAAGYAAAAMVSSLIATVATASVIADQFFRGTPYGMLSNLVVLPVIDLIAMPMAVLACLVMPFGLEAYPLSVMGLAIDYMDAIGAFAAGLPGGAGLIGRIHPWSNALAIAGLLWLCLWQRPWRLLGISPMLVALALAPFAERPDVLVADEGLPIAVRGADGELHVLGAKSNRFVTANWLTADAAPSTPADARAKLDPSLAAGWRCDPLGCVYRDPGALRLPARGIVYVTDPKAFEEDCRLAAVVITRLTAPEDCRSTALVIDRASLARSGAVAIRFRSEALADRSDGLHIATTTNPSSIAPDESLPLVAEDADPDPPLARVAVSLADASRPWINRPPETPRPPAKAPPAVSPAEPQHPTTPVQPDAPQKAGPDATNEPAADVPQPSTEALLPSPTAEVPASAVQPTADPTTAEPRRPALTGPVLKAKKAKPAIAADRLPLDPTAAPDADSPPAE
ncbi:MAG: ComEC/Rec2 family competence protein [Ancalomicrobiaceae bacterium]|nr:ComEC/Rec2 family competence protein [Ancalomicrobiaceae bacterium]